MRIKFLGILTLMIGFSLNSYSQNLSTLTQNFKNEFGFKSDNDAYLFYGQDRYYTNGLFIYYRHALNQQRLPKSLEKVTYEISAGQKMFNPISGAVGIKEMQDRPFAAYLYAGGSASFFYKNEKILKTSLELGVVGPDALGEDAQKLLHRLVGFYKIDGWQYQIKNELAANFTAQYTELLFRNDKNSLDFSFEGYGNIGTIFSGAGAGISFRIGKINQLFHTSYTQAQISNHAKTAKLVKNEVFFYAKPQLNYVAYDATIQGSMFNNDSPVTYKVKPLVLAQQLGFNYSSQRFTFDFGVIFKSKEVRSDAKPHQFGSISLLYRFN